MEEYVVEDLDEEPWQVCLLTRAHQGLATVHHAAQSNVRPPPNQRPGPHSSDLLRVWRPSRADKIKEKLRAWEAENPSLPVHLLEDAGRPGVPTNALQTMHGEVVQLDMDSDIRDSQVLFDEGDILGMRHEAVGIKQGDLIEVTSDTWKMQLLALCLGNFNGCDHFYTDTGKWFVSQGVRTNFVVRQFVRNPNELQPIIDALPSISGSITTLNQLQNLRDVGPSRNVCAHLLKKMRAFQSAARAIHQKTVTKLRDAIQRIGPEDKIMALDQIADILLPPGTKKKGAFPPEALYAVHTSLSLDDVSFRPLLSHGLTPKAYLYEISSRSDVETIQRVEEMVRALYGDVASKRRVVHDQYLSGSELGQFILRARKAIDRNRLSRDWTPHGMLGLSTNPTSAASQGWTTSDRRILHFFHLWAAVDRFKRSSRLHWIGAAILRLLDKYGQETLLNNTTGWTFLQEIGWLKPWDIQSRYQLRLPGVEVTRDGVSVPLVETGDEKLLGPDEFAKSRKRFSGIFCIDSERTADIDDGISLETTDKPDEFWIHVHVADPTSRVSHESWLAKTAELMPFTIYLAGFYQRMLSGDAVRESFSLGEDRPALTFSGKVNNNGDLLDYTIQKTQLADVVYMTPEEANKVCGSEDMPVDLPNSIFSVGKPPLSEKKATRRMTTAVQLSRKQKETLQALGKLTKAIEAKRLRKGAMPVYFPRAQAEVSLDETTVAESPEGFFACSGDPYIKISYGSTQCTVVSSNMVLAGEIAARWCEARSIPIPYRVLPEAAENEKILNRFTSEVFYPQLKAGLRPSDEQYRRLRYLVGAVNLSTTPGAFYTMGVDMYTKATSPLRRFGDLIVHWQISAALLREQRRQQKMEPSAQTDKDQESSAATTTKAPDTAPDTGPDPHDRWLPFSRERLEKEVLPALRVREGHARLLDNMWGPSEWILQALVRAWKLGDDGSAPLPRTFRFTVSQIIPHCHIYGLLDWFDRPAILQGEDLGEAALLANVRHGDVFEVELKDVNVYGKMVQVKAVAKVEKEEEEEGAAAGAAVAADGGACNAAWLRSSQGGQGRLN